MDGVWWYIRVVYGGIYGRYKVVYMVYIDGV